MAVERVGMTAVYSVEPSVDEKVELRVVTSVDEKVVQMVET